MKVSNYFFLFIVVIFGAHEVKGSELGNLYGSERIENVSRAESVRIIEEIQKILETIKEFEIGDGDLSKLEVIGTEVIAISDRLKGVIQNEELNSVRVNYGVDSEVRQAFLYNLIERYNLRNTFIENYNIEISEINNLRDFYLAYCVIMDRLGESLVNVSVGKIEKIQDSGVDVFMPVLSDFLAFSQIVSVVGLNSVRQ